MFQGWIKALVNGEVIHPFGDVMLAPVPLEVMVAALQGIGVARLSGITQVSGPRDISYEAAARHITRRIGASSDLVCPQTSAAAGIRPELVPRHTTLDTSRLGEHLGIRVPEPEHALDIALQLKRPG